jgi:hypothetical protein
MFVDFFRYPYPQIFTPMNMFLFLSYIYITTYLIMQTTHEITPPQTSKILVTNEHDPH